MYFVFKEVKELQALLSREPSDTREFFKNELALAIRDIRNEYDIIAQQNKSDMESWYKLKVMRWNLYTKVKFTCVIVYHKELNNQLAGFRLMFYCSMWYDIEETEMIVC